MTWVATKTNNPEVPRLLRGDCNDDSLFNLADPVFGLDVLFSGGRSPTCEDACDGNDDGAFNISDPIYILGALSLEGTGRVALVL